NGGIQPSSLQWSFSTTSNITGISVVAGDSAIAAGKSVFCAASICLLQGLNDTGIGDGTVAVATFQVSSTPSATAVPISMGGVVASSGGGSSVTVSPASSSGVIALTTTVQPGSLSCNPATVNSPGNANCTITLTAPAGDGGVNVAVSSNNPSITVPANV